MTIFYQSHRSGLNRRPLVCADSGATGEPAASLSRHDESPDRPTPNRARMHYGGGNGAATGGLRSTENVALRRAAVAALFPALAAALAAKHGGQA